MLWVAMKILHSKTAPNTSLEEKQPMSQSLQLYNGCTKEKNIGQKLLIQLKVVSQIMKIIIQRDRSLIV